MTAFTLKFNMVKSYSSVYECHVQRDVLIMGSIYMLSKYKIGNFEFLVDLQKGQGSGEFIYIYKGSGEFLSIIHTMRYTKQTRMSVELNDVTNSTHFIRYR